MWGSPRFLRFLTKKQVDIANYPFCTIDPSVGVVEVPDESQKTGGIFQVKKVVPAVMEFGGHCRSGERRFRGRKD